MYSFNQIPDVCCRLTRVWAASSSSLESSEYVPFASEVSHASTSAKRELRGDPTPVVKYVGDEKGRFMVFGQLPLQRQQKNYIVCLNLDLIVKNQMWFNFVFERWNRIWRFPQCSKVWVSAKLFHDILFTFNVVTSTDLYY